MHSASERNGYESLIIVKVLTTYLEWAPPGLVFVIFFAATTISFVFTSTGDVLCPPVLSKSSGTFHAVHRLMEASTCAIKEKCAVSRGGAGDVGAAG
jgi:hypothetical protein